MDTEKLLEILRITVPVFALLCLGNILSRTGKMSDEHRAFLNWLVYYISLPALIFLGMASQPIDSILKFDFILTTLLSMFAILLIYTLLSLVMRLDKKIAIVMIFCTYWSNVAYMGFPLTGAAFGQRGFLLAAIVNAVSMPVLVSITFVIIGLCSDRKRGILVSIRRAVINPIIPASIAGFLYSWAAGALQIGGDGAPLPAIVKETLGMCEIILTNVGTMGLSLALIAVGGKIRFRSLGKNMLPMTLAVAGKMILLPLISLGITHVFFPESPRDAVGATVLLMAMPTAVTVAVIAAKFELNEEFASSVLTVSLLSSVIFIPAWLYVVL
ncbi:MAG: AEC family transporter [Chitinispirillales bacterium]|jgi:predicted permease|nr:AEC family transporter [Chitinispirillales bacterium]